MLGVTTNIGLCCTLVIIIYLVRYIPGNIFHKMYENATSSQFPPFSVGVICIHPTYPNG
jgi:hypothetical protein